MARLDITPKDVPGGFPTLPLVADSLDYQYLEPATPSDGISFTSTGREVLLVRNTNAGAQTFTVSSTPVFGRSGDLGPYSLAAGEDAVVLLPTLGFQQTGRKVFAVGSAAGVKFAVLRLPPIS